MKRISVVLLGLWTCFALSYFAGCELLCALTTPASAAADSAFADSEMDHSHHGGHHTASAQHCPTRGGKPHQRCLNSFHPAQGVQTQASTGQDFAIAAQLSTF